MPFRACCNHTATAGALQPAAAAQINHERMRAHSPLPHALCRTALHGCRPNCFLAGDWIKVRPSSSDQSVLARARWHVAAAAHPLKKQRPLPARAQGLNHGANGLSQERAYVTGLSAANLVMQRLGEGTPARILDVEPDEPHIKFARDAMKQLREVEESTGLRLPFM